MLFSAMKTATLFLHRLFSVVFLCLFGMLGIASLFVLTRFDSKVKWETIHFIRLSFPIELLVTLILAGVLLIVAKALKKLPGKAFAVLLILWIIAGVIGFRYFSVKNMVYDSLYVVDAASGFARGSYTAIDLDYFQMYPYQLGFCFPLELVYRFLPQINIIYACQCVNWILMAGSICILSKTMAMNGGSKRNQPFYAFFLLNPVFVFYCVFVYGTVPMIFFSSISIYCFISYLKKKSGRYAIGWIVSIGIAYTIKPNAGLPMLAMCIVGCLIAVEDKRSRVFLYGIISICVCLFLSKGIVAFYELRSHKTIGSGITLISRLAMGFQEGGAAPGWFNDFSEDCWKLGKEAGNAMAIESLKTTWSEWLGHPLAGLSYLSKKIVSQWLEASSGSLWFGYISSAAFGREVPVMYIEDSAVRLFLESFMLRMLRITYLFSAAEMIYVLRRKNPSELLLPILLLGGLVYHTLFEAKSLYMIPYIFYLTVVASKGMIDILYSVRKKLNI